MTVRSQGAGQDIANMKPTEPTENLEGLIQSIRQEAVEEARQEAEAIIEAAQEQARTLVQEAKKKTQSSEEESREAIRKAVAAAEHAREQASRDLIVAVQSELTAVLNKLIRQECDDRLKGDALERMIIQVAEAWMQRLGDGPLELVLSERDRDRLGDEFIGRLKEKLSQGVELKCHPDVHSGFRIGRRGETMAYDFTAEAVAEALAAVVNPRIASLLKTDDKSDEAK